MKIPIGKRLVLPVEVFISGPEHARKKFAGLSAQAGQLIPLKVQGTIDLRYMLKFGRSASRARFLALLAIRMKLQWAFDGEVSSAIVTDPFDMAAGLLKTLRANPRKLFAVPATTARSSKRRSARGVGNNSARPGEATKKGGKLRAAFALLNQHPEWSDKSIAQEVGCHPSNLSKNPQWRQSREALRRAGTAPVKQVRDARTGENQLTMR